MHKNESDSINALYDRWAADRTPANEHDLWTAISRFTHAVASDEDAAQRALRQLSNRIAQGRYRHEGKLHHLITSTIRLENKQSWYQNSQRPEFADEPDWEDITHSNSESILIHVDLIEDSRARDIVEKMLQGWTVVEIAADYGVSTTTIFRYIRQGIPSDIRDSLVIHIAD